MSQDSEWIKSKMASLRKQTGLAFDQEVFISMLLCLISGNDKHLLLTAPPNRLSEVTMMTSQISRCLFGFTTAKMTCHSSSSRSDLLDALYHDKDEADSLPGNSNQHKNQRSNDSNQFPYKTSQSFNTIESKSSDKSQLNDPRTHAPYRDDSFTSHKTPISPLDFNLTTQRDRSLSRSSANNYNLSAFQSNLPKDKMMKKERAKYQNEDKKQYTQFTRPAHTIILQGLDMTNESLQSILLELIVTKELRLTNVKYTVPRHAFLIIAVVPENYHRLSISPQLMDRFFISYNFDEDAFTRPNTSFTTTPRSLNLRRHAYMRNDEIKYLSEKTKSIYVNIDVTRYVRDIVVGIRTHPRVKGGLTARCSKDLITVTKSLATLFQRDFLTPDLVTIAAEKVFSHRLHILEVNPQDDQMEKEEGDASIAFDIVAEILRLIYVPV